MASNKQLDQTLCRLRYQLTYRQTLEAMQLILDRRGKTARRAMAAALAVLAGIFFMGFCLDRTADYRGKLSALCLLMGLVVLCYPALAARRTAKRVSRQGGTYELTFLTTGEILLPGGERLSLRGDRAARGFWTPNVIALRPDRAHTICIPLAAVPTGKRQALHQLLAQHIRIHTVTEGGMRT
jgi:hypothetical protein